MMRKYIGFLILLIFVLGDGNVVAQSLGESFFDNGYFFKITSLSPRRVSVVHPPAGDPSFVHYTGVVCVPDTVWYTPTKPFQVYAVADSAFFNCSTVTKVELPATLRSIGVDAFSGTSSLDTLRCYGEIPPVMYYDSINSRSSMGNLSPGSDYYRWRDHIVLRTPCSGIDNYTMSSGWSIFSHFAGENMHMLYKDSICSGENYYLHQFALDRPVSGIYQLSNLSGGLTGCTYDAELHLVVNPTYENVFAYYFCDETSLSYNAHGFNVNNWTRGENTWTNYNTTVNGCDSISRLQFRRMLSVNDFYDSVCAGAPYSRTFGTLRFDLLASETAVPDTDIVLHKDFTPAGDALTSYQVGCSQTITDHIHVNPIIHDTLVANSCEGYPYTWKRTGYNASRTSVTHTNTYSVSGFHRDTLFSQKGCLMYKNLDLHIWQPSDTVLYDTICGNECTLFGSNYISTHGVHTAQYANQHWCDSTVALHLTVRDSYSDQHPGYTQVPIYHTDFNQTENRYAWIFANGSNGWRIKDGYLRVSSGANTNNYNLNVQSDSYASITFNTGDYDSIRIEMPVTVGGESYNDYLKVFLPGTTTSTSYFNTSFSYSSTYKNTRHNQVDTLKLYWHNNANGRGNLEAVRINELTITGISHQLRNHPTTQLNADICEGDTYSEGGHLYSTTGTYLHDYATSVYGCDSLVRLDLKVHENRDTTFEAAFCNGGGLVFDGVTYTQTTFVTNNYEDQWGCDSIRNLDLTVWPTPTTEIDTVHLGDAPLLFRGQSITEDGSYTFVDTTIHGCDSIVKLNVTIHHNQYTTIPAEICDDETYNANGFNVSEPGIYYDTLRTVFGADSIVKLILVVHPTYNKNFYADICEGGSYIFNSHTMIATGSVTDNLMTVYGCDSVVTQHLTVHPIYATTIDTTIWGDEPFDFHGTMVSESGTYHKSFVTQQGCDSLFTLNITIYHNADTIINASICEGDTYSDNGFDASIAGTYSRHTSTVTGADSTITLHLIVNPVYDDTLGATICDRETYSFGINSYGVAGHYTDSLHTYRGCDSVVTLALKVNPVFDTVIYDTVRGDEGYWFYGAHYDSTGVYRDTLPNRYLCDSITELHLQIYPTRTEHIYDTICQGQTYTLHDFNENTTGVFYRHGLFTVVGHSDSTAVLHLCVNPVYDDTLGATICDRETYSFGINSYGVAGHYTDSLHTYRGCDSVVTLALKVNPVFDTVIYDTVRGDEGYWFYGAHYDSTGVYRDTLPNRYLCDSITELHLQIYPTKTEHIYDTICQGQTYTLHDFNENTTGVFYRHGLFTVVGHSDSTAVLHLCVNPVYDDTLGATICDRETYSFGINSYGVAGHYTDSLHTYRGCDSVVTLALKVNPVFDTVIYDTVRGDEGYWFYDVHYDSTGIYRDTTYNRYLCDSITELHLQIYPTRTEHIYDTICQGQTYTLHDFNESTTGVFYRHGLFTVVGHSDSTAVLHLCVNPVYDDTLVQHICDRTIYTGFGNHQLSTTGFTTDSLLTYRMCDSVVTLHLIVDPVYEVHVYDTVRGDEGYMFLGRHLDTTGVYCDTLPTQQGCDSIIFLHLQIYNTATTHLYDTICQAQIYNNYGFIGQTESGTYQRNLFTFGGADSTVFLHLWVNPIYDDTLVQHICDRTIYTGFGNHQLSTTGFTTDSLQTYRMCDSVVTLHLIVDPVYEVDVYDTLRGDGFYDFLGTLVNETGIYCDTLPTVSGCDSIIHLHLKVYKNAYTTLYDTICDRDEYNGFGFSGLVTAGIYVDSLFTYGGADSVVTLHLWVNPVYEVHEYDTICSNRFLLHHNDTLRFAGDYTDTLPTIHGCDSIITMHLFVLPSYDDTFRAEICQGGSYFFHVFEPLTEEGLYRYFMKADNSCDSIETLWLTVHPTYNYTIQDSILPTENYLFGNRMLYDPGFYTDSLTSQYGCDSIVNLQLSNWYLHTTRLHDTICDGDSIFFNDSWCKRDSVYTDTLMADDGMDSLVVLFLKVSPVYNDTIYDSIFCTQFCVFGNDSLNVEGFYTHYLETSWGCDSTVTLNLYVHTTRDLDSSVCMDRLPFLWNGITFPDTIVTDPIVYRDTAIVWNDSANRNIMLAMNVTVVPNPIQTIADTIVENQLPYTFRGYVYDNNVEADTLLLPATVGCDTTTYYSLFYFPNVADTVDTTICYGQLPIEWNGVSFNAPEGVLDITQTTTLLAHTGADSVLTMRVHVLQNTYTTRRDTVVENMLPYEVHGHIYFNACNLDTLVIPNSAGCDSVIYFRLLVNGNGVTMIDTTLCDYLLPINWNGHNFDDDGSTDLLSDTTIYLNQFGADSMVIMRVHILRCTSQVFDSTVCSAQLPLMWNGRTFNIPPYMPTTVVDTIHLYTPTGADSLIILRLHVNETFNQTFYDTICSNHPYTFLGQQYATSCILSANLHTYSGCDSNVVVHLQVWPTETSMFEDVICPATTYGWIDGNSYTEPVVGPFSTLRTVHGCDSTVYLHLVEGEAAVADIWADKSWVEVDDPVVRLADHTLHGESRVWHFPDSTSTQEVVYYTYPNDYDSVRIFLVGTNHDGCVDTTSVLLRLDRDFIGVPNVFTPGLSENNHFSVIGKGLINVEVSIFTRTGLFIYSWQGMDGYWDGTYNGEICPQAAYTYKVTYSTERNPRDRKTKVGTVVLLR